MGKDVRGIERRKCACGEREDFMRSDGATCGYCGCLTTRHSKKDARYFSYSVSGTSAAGTSESASPEKWKDGRPRVVPEVVGSNPRSLSEESSLETDFIPEPCAETSKYGRKRTRVETDNYVSWEKIVL